MKSIHIGIGIFAASKDITVSLKTVALGSCIAIVMMDPKNRSIGMVHIALPDSTINEERARKDPGTFADTGVPILLKEMQKLGWDGKSRLIIKLAGGAAIIDPSNTFNIGKRNLLAIRRILWSHRLAPISEEVGGTISRSVYVQIKTGKIRISSPGMEDRAL